MNPERLGPFAGIVSERPYPVTGLNTQRWIHEIAVEHVFFHELILTQDGVYFAKLFSTTPSTDAYPHVVLWQNQMYLEDGHHRALRYALRGELDMLMRVYRSG